MNTLITALTSFTDILNLGRLIFYTFAGALVMGPLRAIVCLLSESQHEQSDSFFVVLSGHAKIDDWYTFGILSLVAGFVLSTIGFSTIIDGAGTKAVAALEPEAKTSSFAYNYPRMTKANGGEKDYASWLISEYYRFVEIAVFLPLGAMMGLVLLAVYALLFLLRDAGRPSVAGFTDAHLSLVVLSATVLGVYYHLWPEVWEKRVLLPVVGAYLRAKRDLVKRLEEMEKA